MDTNFVYTVYKTTNLVNTRFYYGIHRTQNPQDRYLGSGVVIRRAIMKYGRESFCKEVLFQFETLIEANAKEIELISAAKENPLCYNLHSGGSGDAREQISAALKGKKRRPLSKIHRQKLSKLRKGKPKSLAWRRKMSQIRTALGDVLTPEARQQQARSLSRTLRRRGNPNLGKKWDQKKRQQMADKIATLRYDYDCDHCGARLTDISRSAIGGHRRKCLATLGLGRLQEC